MSEELERKYGYLIGRKFHDPRHGIMTVDKVGVAYIHATTSYDNYTRPYEARHVEALVLFHELYEAADDLLCNLTDAGEHVHSEQGYVLADVAALWRVLNMCDQWENRLPFEAKRDQYDDPVPDDLVELPNLARFREMQAQGLNPDVATDHMQWYELRDNRVDRRMFVPLHQVPPDYRPYFVELELDDKGAEFDYIPSVLYRYTEEDGFYHA